MMLWLWLCVLPLVLVWPLAIVGLADYLEIDL